MINLLPSDRRNARAVTTLQTDSGRQSFLHGSTQHHTGNKVISRINFTLSESRFGPSQIQAQKSMQIQGTGNWPPGDLLDRLFPPI